jgi:hypothetical protein
MGLLQLVLRPFFVQERLIGIIGAVIQEATQQKGRDEWVDDSQAAEEPLGIRGTNPKSSSWPNQ